MLSTPEKVYHPEIEIGENPKGQILLGKVMGEILVLHETNVIPGT